ncbi:MAG: hypothetical protein LW768_04605 [Rubrivivax sp.]|jgi:hypothetical protein|nr:hypothetical protein [Rubrivivax sp.]
MTPIARRTWIACAAAVVCTGPAVVGHAQTTAAGNAQQKVTGPQARYWLSAETASGMGFGMGGAPAAGGGGMGNIADMMNAMRNPNAPRKSLRLDLGATRDGAPSSASHQIPPGMALGASLPLIAPEPATPPREVDGDRDVPEFQRGEAKGRLLFFWGCGDKVGPGQPIVLDFAKLADGQLPPDMRGGVSVRPPRSGPGAARDRGYVYWPNKQMDTAVPAHASLVGNHVVQGNLNPEIRFAVGTPHDFMEPLRLQRTPVAGGTQKLSWNAAASALGYFLTGMGGREMAGGGGEMVLWNSSAVRLLGGETLMGFLAPSETERLIREKVVLPATTTECQIPREVIAAAGGELMMHSLNAFGPELNVVHPPRPQDPKIDWNQEYAVKLRLRSSTGSIAGMDDRRGRRGSPESAEAPSPPPAEGQAQKPKTVDAVKDALKGLFGR